MLDKGKPIERNNRVLIVAGKSVDRDALRTVLNHYQSQSQMNLLTYAHGNPGGELTRKATRMTSDIHEAFDGQQALEMVSNGCHNGTPFASVFIDTDLEGEWDVQKTVEEMLRAFYFQEVVVVGNESYEWEALLHNVRLSERVTFVKKPFDPVIINQVALNLSRRATAGAHARNDREQLEYQVREKAMQLERILEEEEEYSLGKRRDLLTKMKTQKHRVLIVDDNDSIHKDFHKVLGPPKVKPQKEALLDLEAEIFGDDDEMEEPENLSISYEVDSAYQGKDALNKVIKAEEEERPYALAFMDVRMPPGWDGIHTIEKIWARDPYIEMVIVTAHSDYTWGQIINKIGSTDRLLFLRKPFDPTAVKQMALTLTQKWALGSVARRKVDELDKEIVRRSAQLKRLLEEF